MIRQRKLFFWSCADALAITLLTAFLIAPWIRLKYLDNWFSIESTFIADARFLAENWPHPNWQPLWYGGTRWDYIYPPALRYGAAAIIRYTPYIPPKAYHIYTGLLYCLGIAGVFVLVRVGSGSRGAAWLGAAGAAFVSPAFLFMKHIRGDSIDGMPQRISVLVRYGEGPHISAFALLVPALAAAYLALKGRRPGMLALASLGCALAVSNNFYGATSLATLYPVLVWSVFVTHLDWRVWLRALVIPALAYGLTAWWLVPSYFRITMANLKIVSQPGNWWSIVLALFVAAAFGLASWRLARGRRELDYTVFVIGALVFFSLNVLGQYYIGFRVAGEPERLVPELDLCWILAGVELARRLWLVERRRLVIRAAVALAVLMCFIFPRHYIRHPWRLYVWTANPQGRLEYKLTEWVAKNLPGARTFASGTVRFWWNAWFNEAQIGGGSEQGLLNPYLMPMYWEVMLGPEVTPTIQYLQTFGVDAIIVHEEHSKSGLKDFVYPKKFRGALPVIYDNGQGDIIYRIPRRYPGLARVVDTRKALSIPPVHPDRAARNIEAYSALVERGPEAPVSTAWEGNGVLRIRARVAAGQSVLVQTSHDPCWRAYSGGRSLSVKKDVMGQMLIEAPPGEHDLRLVFEPPFENFIGRIVTVLALAACLALFAAAARQREVPA